MADGQLTLRVPSERLAEIDALFQEQGIVEWSIRLKRDHKIIIGRTAGGGTIRYSVYTAEGFRERSMSSCYGVVPSKRKAEANRLSDGGLTQTEIAERLGCSQKTVLNDLSRAKKLGSLKTTK